MKAQSTKYYLI